MAHPFFRHFCAVFLSALCFVGILKLNQHNSKIVDGSKSIKDNFSLDVIVDFDDDDDDDDDDLAEEEPKEERRLLRLDELKSFGTAAASGSNKTLYFLGLFELSTKIGLRKEGESEVSAARLAVDHVNRMGVLPGYTLRLLINDTKVRGGV